MQKMCCEFCIDFYRQLKATVIVIVIGKNKCNCNLIVIDINVIDPCLFPTAAAPSAFLSRRLWHLGLDLNAPGLSCFPPDLGVLASFSQESIYMTVLQSQYAVSSREPSPPDQGLCHWTRGFMLEQGGRLPVHVQAPVRLYQISFRTTPAVDRQLSANFC